MTLKKMSANSTRGIKIQEGRELLLTEFYFHVTDKEDFEETLSK